MNKNKAMVVKFAAVLFAGALVWGAFATLPAQASLPGVHRLADKDAKEITVKGTFEWNRKKGQKNDLTGTLTPLKEGGWKVVWNFKWKNQPVTYEGEVKGDITNGEVSGTGNEIKGKRTFSFEGKAKDGVWTFQCFETTKGKEPQGSGEVAVQK